MHKTTSLLILTASLAVGQSLQPTFTGRMVSCGDGYTVFQTFGGQLIRTSDRVAGCKEYSRARQWRVYTEPGGAHPDSVMAIEPVVEVWENTPQVVEGRRWKWFKWVRK